MSMNLSNKSICESILNDLAEKEKSTIISIQDDFKSHQSYSSKLKNFAKSTGIFLVITSMGMLLLNRNFFRPLIRSIFSKIINSTTESMIEPCHRINLLDHMDEAENIIKQLNIFCYVGGASGLFFGLVYKSNSIRRRKMMRRMIISTLKTYLIRANINTDSLNRKLNLNSEQRFKSIFDGANQKITYLQENENKIKSNIDFLFNSLFIAYSIRPKIIENLYKII
jgi:hypothetical protein